MNKLWYIHAIECIEPYKSYSERLLLKRENTQNTIWNRNKHKTAESMCVYIYVFVCLEDWRRYTKIKVLSVIIFSSIFLDFPKLLKLSVFLIVESKYSNLKTRKIRRKKIWKHLYLEIIIEDLKPKQKPFKSLEDYSDNKGYLFQSALKKGKLHTQSLHVWEAGFCREMRKKREKLMG